MAEAGVEEVFLPEVANVGPYLTGYFEMIVDDEPDTRRQSHRHNALGQLAHYIHGLTFGPELKQIRTAVAKLACEPDRITAGEIGRVHKRVETAVGERFHTITRQKTM